MGDQWTTSYFCPYGYTAAQGMLILPDPYDTMVYNLFHQDLTLAPDFYAYPEELFVTTISFLDHPKGRVMKKRELILKERVDFGGLTATKQSNGIDWWIIAGPIEGKRLFILSIDKEGIKVKNMQDVGIENNIRTWARSPKLSQDGKVYSKFHIMHGLEIMDFDRKTGVLSNARYTPFWKVKTPFEFGNSIEYSTDSKLLYITYGNELVQFDLMADDIFESRLLVDTFVIDTSEGIFWSRFYQMQMGADNKIYMSHLNGAQTMHVIHDPNGRGKDCNFRMRDLKLRTWNALTMPYFPNFRLGPDTTVAVADFGMNNVTISPNPTSGIVRLSQSVLMIKVFNHLGALVISKANTNEIDLFDLESGMYIISLSDNLGITSSHKIIKID